ncbi:hypothetical protein [Carboxydothermus ferrireducens]|uniref:Uncharacterized protein n=1 Tax=Carboxydothermus ferrireducens DSM 11255 TaxID=1119529 RepID=A0ABX2R7K2_9THEO|nr:hypothetical protein [Carboxydothermus ferrireducens]NYE57151.1 hypothetical protein [Carboxydothermus ferrireducens DSM 11255]
MNGLIVVVKRGDEIKELYLKADNPCEAYEFVMDIFDWGVLAILNEEGLEYLKNKFLGVLNR